MSEFDDEFAAGVAAARAGTGPKFGPSVPCRNRQHKSCYPWGNPEHIWCDCHCHEGWD